LGDSAAHRFRNLGQGTLGGASGSFPFSATKIIEPSPTPFPLSPGNAAPPPLTTSPPVSDMLVADPHLDLPRTYQWNIAVEQSLGSSQSLSVTYIGAVGRDLLRVRNLLNPNANFAFANVTSNSATSDYNTLQVEFQRRLSQGLQALASYTFSHSIDIASTDAFATYLNTPASIANPNIDRGNSDFDIRHSFSAGITYDLPSPESNKIAHAALGGWSVDSFIFARTAPPSRDVVPSWSRDGHWVYFASDRTGRNEVWKMPATGGPAVQMTHQGGFAAFESPDGRFLYYAKGLSVPGIWRIPTNGGEEIEVISSLEASYWGYWAVVENGIYYLDTTAKPGINFFDLTTHGTKRVFDLENAPASNAPGLAISPDRKTILYTQLDVLNSDIILVENFR
jgi:WD40-like Beta Propeller Repeat